ncbi:hypothetical protein P171DRAFT_504398 [Karstenula rhodostoma CBS 690.94]|uniref:Uncharacterized protein n=1 Tax=Karstenula rhodostoma CBS 690.94 TaxID=1392251 RepID=A0A9P4U7C8_9PLEO|nr:hypothetical protein P171DRAFT_504398 [Karstenula rhodostoma CBS 690.94]
MGPQLDIPRVSDKDMRRIRGIFYPTPDDEGFFSIDSFPEVLDLTGDSPIDSQSGSCNMNNVPEESPIQTIPRPDEANRVSDSITAEQVTRSSPMIDDSLYSDAETISDAPRTRDTIESSPMRRISRPRGANDSSPAGTVARATASSPISVPSLCSNTDTIPSSQTADMDSDTQVDQAMRSDEPDIQPSSQRSETPSGKSRQIPLFAIPGWAIRNKMQSLDQRKKNFEKSLNPLPPLPNGEKRKRGRPRINAPKPTPTPLPNGERRKPGRPRKNAVRVATASSSASVPASTVEPTITP